MASHTPGPWTWAKGTERGTLRIDAPLWEELATVYRNDDPRLDAQGKDNARLIAAAPDLLAALRLFAEDPSIAREYPAFASSARAAIAKAEGRQP